MKNDIKWERKQLIALKMLNVKHVSPVIELLLPRFKESYYNTSLFQSLESKQPVENHLQHRSGSETDGPMVLQWFPFNGFNSIPRNGTRVEKIMYMLIYQISRAMQTCKFRFLGGIVLFLAFVKNYTHRGCSQLMIIRFTSP